MKKRLGFTLIELLVVLSIISLLSSITLSSLSSARTKARDSRRKQDMAQIQRALELYYDQNGRYPASGGATNPNASWSNSGDTSWNTLQTALTPYISKLSKDPNDNGTFGAYSYSYFSYGYGCDGQWYMIVYSLENANGPDTGITACDSTFFQYGGAGANTAVKTLGGKSR